MFDALISSLKLKYFRSNPSLAWLFPSDKLWKEDEVLVQSKEVNITVKNIEEFYQRMGRPENIDIHNDVKGHVRDLTPPNVPVHCLYGQGVPTTER